MVFFIKKISAQLKYIFFCFISTVLLLQCASIQSPSGGKKDTNPPTVLSSIPKQAETMVKPSMIQIQFDEFFVLKNLANELLISPPLNEAPIISQKGKSLFIELQEELNNNSTYTLNFGKGIADYHEGNVLKDYALVFSTGAELDSLEIQGSIAACPDKTLPEDLIVGIYQTDSLTKDSTIYLNKPDYFSLIDEQNQFHIKYIRDGNYELIAFKDVNANYKYDGASEQIAFHDKIININDSVTCKIWLFSEEDTLKLLDNKDNGRIHWTYNKEIDTATFHADTTLKYFSEIKKDSLFLWPYNMSSDSAYVWAKVGQRCDSILIKKDSLKRNINILTLSSDYIKDSENIHLKTSEPITSIDSSKIELVTDSTKIDFTPIKGDFTLDIEFEHLVNKKYNLIINQGAIKGLNKSENDSTNISFYTKSESVLAGLKINTTLQDTVYFIELLKDGDIIETIDSGKSLYFEKLLPGRYEMRLIVDSNQDGKWTAGNYFENVLPEKVYYYPEIINLRANWELEVDWEINP